MNTKVYVSHCARYFLSRLHQDKHVDKGTANWQHAALRTKGGRKPMIELFDLKSGEVYESWTYARFTELFVAVAGPNAEIDCLEYDTREGQKVIGWIRYCSGRQYMPLR